MFQVMHSGRIATIGATIGAVVSWWNCRNCCQSSFSVGYFHFPRRRYLQRKRAIITSQTAGEQKLSVGGGAGLGPPLSSPVDQVSHQVEDLQAAASANNAVQV